MRPDFLRKLLGAAPFAPFRVFVSEGGYYDVSHPEAARIAAGVLEVAVKPTGFAGPPGERRAFLSFVHIARIEVYSAKSSWSP
jgi:hypothetical protein